MKYEKIGKTKKKIKNLKEVIKMKDLKAFLEVMGKDKALSEKVRSASDVKEMVKIANEAGYAVTEDDMNDLLMEAVAGGGFFDDLLSGVKKEAVDVGKKSLKTLAKSVDEGKDAHEIVQDVTKTATQTAIIDTLKGLTNLVN